MPVSHSFPHAHAVCTPTGTVRTTNRLLSVCGDTPIREAIEQGSPVGHGCVVVSYEYKPELCDKEGRLALPSLIATALQSSDVPSDMRVQIGTLRDTNQPGSGAAILDDPPRMCVIVWSHDRVVSEELDKRINHIVAINEDETIETTIKADVKSVTQIPQFGQAISGARVARMKLVGLVEAALQLKNKRVLLDVVQCSVQQKEGTDGYWSMSDYSVGGNGVVFRSPAHGSMIFTCPTDEGRFTCTASEGWIGLAGDATAKQNSDGWVSREETISACHKPFVGEDSCATLTGPAGTQFIDPRWCSTLYAVRRYGAAFAAVVGGTEKNVITHELSPLATVFGPIPFDFETNVVYGGVDCRHAQQVIDHAPREGDNYYFPCDSPEARESLYQRLPSDFRGEYLNDKYRCGVNGQCRCLPREWFQ